MHSYQSQLKQRCALALHLDECRNHYVSFNRIAMGISSVTLPAQARLRRRASCRCGSRWYRAAGSWTTAPWWSRSWNPPRVWVPYPDNTSACTLDDCTVVAASLEPHLGSGSHTLIAHPHACWTTAQRWSGRVPGTRQQAGSHTLIAHPRARRTAGRTAMVVGAYEIEFASLRTLSAPFKVPRVSPFSLERSCGQQLARRPCVALSSLCFCKRQLAGEPCCALTWTEVELPAAAALLCLLWLMPAQGMPI